MDLIDLHTHTTASDGTDSPTELVHKAHAAGLVAVAITDHDTIDGLEEARRAGQECGIRIIDGCELSVRTRYGEVHILGLWLPRDSSALQERLIELRRLRGERNVLIVEKLRSLGCDIHMDEVLAEGKGSVGRPHIARVMVRKGFVPNECEAFEQYLARGCKAWFPKEVLEPEVAVRLLADLGATVSLAHPFLQGYPVSWLEDFVQKLIPYGLDTLEAWHSEHSPAQTRLCVDWAKKYGIGLSGGSDYHGENKPGIHLGVGRGGLRVPLDVLEKLEARRRASGLPC